MTAGQVSDYTGARALLSSLPTADWLLGNRGYDADWFREALVDKKITPCIRVESHATSPSHTTNAATGSATGSKSCQMSERLEARGKPLRPKPKGLSLSNRTRTRTRCDRDLLVMSPELKTDTRNQSQTIAQSERTSDIRINVSADRGPVKYRLLKELRRNLRKLKWKLWQDRRLRANGGFLGHPPMASDLGRYR